MQQRIQGLQLAGVKKEILHLLAQEARVEEELQCLEVEEGQQEYHLCSLA